MLPGFGRKLLHRLDYLGLPCSRHDLVVLCAESQSEFDDDPEIPSDTFLLTVAELELCQIVGRTVQGT